MRKLPNWLRLFGALAARPLGAAARARSLHDYADLGRALAETDAKRLDDERGMRTARLAALGIERAVRLEVSARADLAPAREPAPRSRGVSQRLHLLPLGLSLGASLACAPALAAAQDVKIRDLAVVEGAAPIRLVGYGLVVGLDGTGDRGMGTRGSGQTVQSVVNLLRRFNVEVPSDMLRTRNVAAVLVTAETSPYLRAGGRFDVHVSSLGDARSLKGGVLWMTPLVAEAGGQPFAAAQGPLVLSEGIDLRARDVVETTARVPSGGQLEAELPRPRFAGGTRLLLKEPDVTTALRITDAINRALGANTARVEDDGAVALTLADDAQRATTLARIRDLAVRPERVARLVIDARDGTVVAGGDITVGEAVVSHGGVTLTVGGSTGAAPASAPSAGDANAVGGDVRVAPGTSVQRIATALHAVQTPPGDIAAIFSALRDVGALSAELVLK